MLLRRIVLLAVLLFARPALAVVGDASTAAGWVNALGLDILRKTDAGSNALLSPYSIQLALAMTYEGADGETRREMWDVLHYTDPEGTGVEPGASWDELQAFYSFIPEDAAKKAKARGDSASITFDVANRLYVQKGYALSESFLQTIDAHYEAATSTVDFAHKPDDSRRAINVWVEEQTRKRIRDLIPPGGVSKDTRLALVNALYLKASWAAPFSEEFTELRPFRLSDGKAVNVPTMRERLKVGYDHRGYHEIVIPYVGGDLLFVILLPDENSSLAALEKQLTPELLSSARNAPMHQITVEIPKFTLEPPAVQLADILKELGMKTAFDARVANFSRMSDQKLCLSAVYHKTYLSLDEAGTEAAAATAVMVSVTSMPPPRGIKIDRPFLFAIQDRESGACLFLGRMMDPR